MNGMTKKESELLLKIFELLKAQIRKERIK